MVRFTDLVRVTSRSKLTPLGWSLFWGFLSYNTFEFPYGTPGIVIACLFALVALICLWCCIDMYREDYTHLQHNRKMQEQLQTVSAQDSLTAEQAARKTRRLFVPPPLR